MQQEIEVKFLNVDFDDVREKLKSIGATCEQPMRLMRRTIFDSVKSDFFKVNGQRLRVRDEGNKVTITYKSDGDGDYDNEIEIVVDSYDNSIQLLNALGYESISVQESKREEWSMNGIEIVLDEWPWLSPYIEIEGNNEAGIKKVADELGFEWSKAVTGSVDNAYAYDYKKWTEGDSIGGVNEVVFNRETPPYLKDRQ